MVVLAGGGSRRLGHDKLAATLLPGAPTPGAPSPAGAGGTVLDALLTGLAEALPGVAVTAVGPPRPTVLAVSWRREDPAGGGPVAALAAGLTGLAPTDVVVVVAGDLPFAAPALPHLLTALATAGVDADGVVGVDPGGRDQLLLGAHRAGPLLAAVGPAPGGRSVRSVLQGLRLVRVELAGEACLDVDTPADLDRARRVARALTRRSGGPA